MGSRVLNAVQPAEYMIGKTAKSFVENAGLCFRVMKWFNRE